MCFLLMTPGLVWILTQFVHWFISRTWWGVPLVFICKEIFNWRGKGWSIVAGPFRELAVLYGMLSISISYEMSNVWAMVSTFVYLPRFVLSTDFWKNGLEYLPWTSSISYLHTKLRIIGTRVSSLANDSPFGVWYREWTAFCLYGDPDLVLCF